MPGSIAARENLREFGGSIVVLGTNQLLKVHIHTDTPDRVFELAASWGTIEKTKADDMRLQHEELHEAEKNDVAIVVDSSCDLPDEIIDEFGMVVVPIQVMHDGDTYLDRIDLRGDEIYRRMIEEGHIFTTSQPTPGAFAKAFEDADNQAQNTLGVLLSAGLSGTFASAQGAARAMKDLSITLVDSRSVSIGLGMQALRAAELAEEGWDIPSITSELARIRPQCGGLFTVDTFENLLRSGRVSRGRAWLGSLLDIKPILEINREGRVVPLDRVRGRDALMDKVMEHLEERLTPRPKILRMAVVHANAPEAAEEARTEVVARFQPRQCFFGPVTAALGVHAGPGAWGVFYQVED